MGPSIPSDSQPLQGVGDQPHRAAPVSSDELLPPVEPPSARFILQLFVIPAVIVGAVVLLWFLIESLARRDAGDADEIVRALRSSNQARFQRADDLTHMLRLPQRYPDLKTNRELAAKLAALLDEQITAGDDSDAEVKMRFFLTAALGEFHVTDGLPVLMRAAQSDPDELVRRQAIKSIAVLAGSMADRKQPIVDESLNNLLLELSNDQNDLIRSEAAFAIGVVAASSDDERLPELLELLAKDLYTDARFNAALGLARIESPLAAKALAEVLDPESIESSLLGVKPISDKAPPSWLRNERMFKRNTIVSNAVASISRLNEADALSADDRKLLEDALVKFIEAAPQMKEPAPDELIEGVKRTMARVRKSNEHAGAR